MIGGVELMMLKTFSKETKNGGVVLDFSIATPNIVKLAKELCWPPYDKVDGKIIKM